MVYRDNKVAVSPPQALVGETLIMAPDTSRRMALEALLRRPWNTLMRVVLVAIAASALLFIPDFVAHTRGHFTGSIADTLITGRWHVVAINITVFIAFLIPLSFRRKMDWKEYGLVTAFFISLFVEMYGIPLILMFASERIAPAGNETLETPVTYELFGVEFHLTVPMVYGVVLMVLGTALIMLAWVQLYRGVQREELVTTGLYAVSRNPQYLGFMIVIVGWWVGWPSILVTAFAPILLFMYWRLCRVEARELADLPGYEEYAREVPLVV